MRAVIVLGLILAASTSLRAQEGTVQIQRFWSRTLGATKHYVVYLPPSYARDSSRRFPVAYYLHGQDDNETDLVAKAQIDLVMDSLVQAGIPEMIIVMPDGDNGWWIDGDSSVALTACAGNAGTGEPPETYCVARVRYDEYLVRDLVPRIDSLFRTKADRRARGVAGASMGGFGAVVLALTHPTIWSAAMSEIGVVSPLYVGPRPFTGTSAYATTVGQVNEYWKSRGWPAGPLWASVFGSDISGWVRRDPLHLLRRLRDESPTLVPALYLDAARDDTLFVDQSRVFHSELDALHITHVFTEWPGGHDWSFVRAHVGSNLAWLGDQIAH